MDVDARSQRGARTDCEGLTEVGGDHRQHRSGRGIAASRGVHLAPGGVPSPAGRGGGPQPGPRRREEMEELAPDDPGRDHVRQRQPGGWAVGVPTERAGGAEGAERMRHLLLGDIDGHADAEQAVRDLQEHVPLGVSVPVVQEQQPEYLSAVPQQLCVCVSIVVG